ncbi:MULTISPECIES: hypothetical protein [Glaesserella]|uniref:Adhesin n=1 Tax=Glaesserella australis TaxID=2094024 RepID=A0A328BYT3_9PAST|nr:MULTISPECIES: hypothetical protein [Glaesserella]AUI65864.1 hypothetical protein CJD39_04425 [Glaesserella sp. 15-184]RAL17990.1 hypothetical protein C5N92_10155 [Glaesserella australis]HDX1003764.1 hypothetical protein [Pasteurella multocida]
MRKITISLISMILFSGNALASDSSTNIIYSCTTTENKQLTIKKSQSDYIFSYDSLIFSNSINDVMKHEGTSIDIGSGFTSIGIELHNQGSSYIIGHAYPNNKPKELIEPGLLIQNAKDKAVKGIFECNPKKQIKHNFDTKIMRKTGVSP